MTFDAFYQFKCQWKRLTFGQTQRKTFIFFGFVAFHNLFMCKSVFIKAYCGI